MLAMKALSFALQKTRQMEGANGEYIPEWASIYNMNITGMPSSFISF
jgi:hypothetical protein